MTRILSLLCVLLVAAFTTADSTPLNLRGGHELIRAFQNHPYALDTLPTDGIPSADHLEDTTASRKLATRLRRSKTPQAEWTPKLDSIPEDREIVNAIPSRNAKRNVHSISNPADTSALTGVSMPQRTRSPLQREQGSLDQMNTQDIEHKILAFLNLHAPKFEPAK
jgi:hypothetical protein